MSRFIWMLCVCYALFFCAPAFADVAGAGAQDVGAVTDVVADVEEAPAAPAVPELEVPETLEEAGASLMDAVDAFKSGAWLLFILALIQILIFGLKRLVPTRWIIKDYGSLVVISLSGVASVLLLLTGGATLQESLVIFVFAAGSKYAHDIMHEVQLLRHRDKTPEAPQEA